MSVAFKEWSLVCDALRAGTQSLILRKGGIAEGRSGFQWKHDTFYLFPTHFHEQAAQVLAAPPGWEPSETGEHQISLFATLECHAVLDDWERVLALAPWHGWTEQVVRERFDYTGQRALSVGVVRIYRLEQPFVFPDAPGYGGCRSWVNVPAPEPMPAMQPVLDDVTHAARVASIREIFGLPLTSPSHP